jgi:hypothetical protein
VVEAPGAFPATHTNAELPVRTTIVPRGTGNPDGFEGGFATPDFISQTPRQHEAELTSTLGYLTPAHCAAKLTAWDNRLRNPDQLRRSPVAPPTQLRQFQPGTLASVG